MMHLRLYEADSAFSNSMQPRKASVWKPFYLAHYLYRKANIATLQQDIQEGKHYN
jgi:hypothetical protein